MAPIKYSVFCDFDGTITTKDVGYNLFYKFSGGKNATLIPDWKAGRITSRQCLLLEAKMVKATWSEISDFLNNFELSHGIKEFVSICQSKNAPFTVLSDGLDFYINHILDRYQLSMLKVLANNARIEDNRLKITFPHENKRCLRCGLCKGEVIEEAKLKHGNETKIVFIGDGYSDICAAPVADILFAKKDLEEYCVKNNIPYIGYNDFYDIINALKKMKLLG